MKAKEIKPIVLEVMTGRNFKVLNIDCRSSCALVELPDKSGRLIEWYKGINKDQLIKQLNFDPLYLGEYLAPGKFNVKNKKPLN